MSNNKKIPEFYELFTAIMDYLADGNEHSIKELRKHCANAFALPEEERRKQLDNGQNILANRVGWACTCLKKANLVHSYSRGIYEITTAGMREIKNAEGSDAIITFGRLVEINPDIREYKEKARLSESVSSEAKGPAVESSAADSEAQPSDAMTAAKPPGAGTSAQPAAKHPSAQPPRERIEDALEEMNTALSAELMKAVMSIKPQEFEKLIVKLLIKMGYGPPNLNESAATRFRNDEGIDGIVIADRFGFDAVYTQAKQWKEDSVVGRPEIQRFVGALAGQGASKGLYITTARYSEEAREYANKQLHCKVILINGRQLCKLLIEYNVGVSEVESYTVKRLDSGFFETLM